MEISTSRVRIRPVASFLKSFLISNRVAVSSSLSVINLYVNNLLQVSSPCRSMAKNLRPTTMWWRWQPGEVNPETGKQAEMKPVKVKIGGFSQIFCQKMSKKSTSHIPFSVVAPSSPRFSDRRLDAPVWRNILPDTPVLQMR